MNNEKLDTTLKSIKTLEDKNKVAWFAETYKHVGHGEIWVVAPVGSANSPASIGAAAEIAKVMVEQGVSPRAIKMNSYQAAEGDRQIVNLKKRHKRKFSLFTNLSLEVEKPYHVPTSKAYLAL